MKNSRLGVWIDATRPKTLPLALISICLGSSLAYLQGTFSGITLVLALVTASLLQILSNLANDYGDAVKGTDNEERIGPTRAIQSGGISLDRMKKAMVVVVVAALVSGALLLALSVSSLSQALLFIALGVCSILAAIAYTVGTKPYGYVGLGDIAVLFFFGFVGVIGTAILHGTPFDALLLVPATASGLLAVAVLNINNLRDIDNDELSGKHTLPVRIGFARAKLYHLVLCGLAWALFASYLVFIDASVWAIAIYSVALAPVALHCEKVKDCDYPLHVIPLMGDVVKTALAVNALFIIALHVS